MKSGSPPGAAAKHLPFSHFPLTSHPILCSQIRESTIPKNLS